MNYIPEHQYRCTIIRGKSQTDMEDLLPLYANMVHKFCPCTENEFKSRCCATLSSVLFNTSSFNTLPERNQKKINNKDINIIGTDSLKDVLSKIF